MKKSKKNTSVARFTIIFVCACMSVALAGCGTLRFAPSEAQKQNAWLHNRTAAIAAQTAKAENVSQVLQALTQLGEKQSQALTAYYGFPEEFPPAEKKIGYLFSHLKQGASHVRVSRRGSRPFNRKAGIR